MTVALADVRKLCNSLKSLTSFGDSEKINNSVQAFYNERHTASATINILADALYDVMTRPDLKNACFDYLGRGPEYAAGPISILSGISRDQALLVRNFSSVALYGAGAALKNNRLPGSLGKSYRLLREAAQIIRPLVRNEKPSAGLRFMLNASNVLFPSK